MEWLGVGGWASEWEKGEMKEEGEDDGREIE